jgi:CRISPR/Cas system CSM-associated protein Csm3 (group 7 of RAMP superfamily)
MARSYDKQIRRREQGKVPGTAPASGASVQPDAGPDAAEPYRTLFVGTLEQESALTVGGSEGFGAVDDPLCRDGAGRYTLRGTGLAGALVATARRLYGETDLAAISRSPGSAPAADAPLPDSLWRVFTSHPDMPIPRPELRPGVGIRQDTGAAREGALFDSEVLPRGTKWPFRLEVKTGKPGGAQAEGIALAALREWEKGYCWAGANIARGLGWMRLTSLRIYRLKQVPAQVDCWPDSSRSLTLTLAELSKVKGVRPFSSDEAKQFGIQVPERTAAWYYQDLEGSVQVGQAEDDGYGLDGLAVGGHGTAVLAVRWDGAHMLWPDGAQSPQNTEAFDPDFAIALTRVGPNHWKPFIPGSSLRGPLRHVLSRHLRSAGNRIRDPLVQTRRPADEQADPVEDLFGSLDRNAALLVRDAHLDGDDWRGAWLQQHAEDEFSAGAFSSAKFDRMAVLRGRFKWRLVVQAATAEELKGRVARLETALNYATQGFMGLGGQQWRGLGWCRWEITRTVERRAGDHRGQP